MNYGMKLIVELRKEENFHDYKLKKSKYYMESMDMLTLLKFH